MKKYLMIILAFTNFSYGTQDMTIDEVYQHL